MADGIFNWNAATLTGYSRLIRPAPGSVRDPIVAWENKLKTDAEAQNRGHAYATLKTQYITCCEKYKTTWDSGRGCYEYATLHSLSIDAADYAQQLDDIRNDIASEAQWAPDQIQKYADALQDDIPFWNTQSKVRDLDLPVFDLDLCWMRFQTPGSQTPVPTTPAPAPAPAPAPPTPATPAPVTPAPATSDPVTAGGDFDMTSRVIDLAPMQTPAEVQATLVDYFNHSKSNVRLWLSGAMNSLAYAGIYVPKDTRFIDPQNGLDADNTIATFILPSGIEKLKEVLPANTTGWTTNQKETVSIIHGIRLRSTTVPLVMDDLAFCRVDAIKQAVLYYKECYSKLVKAKVNGTTGAADVDGRVVEANKDLSAITFTALQFARVDTDITGATEVKIISNILPPATLGPL